MPRAGPGRLFRASFVLFLLGVVGESGTEPVKGALCALGEDEPHGEAAAGSSAIAAE